MFAQYSASLNTVIFLENFGISGPQGSCQTAILSVLKMPLDAVYWVPPRTLLKHRSRGK